MLNEKEQLFVKNIDKRNKVLKGTVLFFIVGILGMFIFAFYQIPKIEATWEKVIANTKNIETTTKHEIFIKDIAINHIEIAKDNLLDLVYSKMQLTTALFFIVICSLIGTINSNKKYKNIINKLK